MRDAFWNFVIEREMVRTKKEAGERPPYTDVPRLRDYWFPNIRRTDDPTWKWWKKFIAPIDDPERLLTATIAFRLFSKIETGSKIKPVLTEWGWDTHAVLSILGPEPDLFNTRLPVGVLPKSLDAACGVMERVLTRSDLYFLVGTSMSKTTDELSSVRGIGRSLAYEIACDLQHTVWLEEASDAYTWAEPTAAAVRGAGAVLEAELNPDQGQARWTTIELMADLHEEAGGAWGWELREVQRALSMFGLFKRRELPPRRFRWK